MWVCSFIFSLTLSLSITSAVFRSSFCHRRTISIQVGRVWAGKNIRKKCQDRKLQIMHFKAAVLVLKYYFQIDRVVNCFSHKTKLKTTSDFSLSEIYLWKLVFSIWCMRKMIDWLYLFIWQPRLESLDVWWSTNKVSVAGEKFSNEIPCVSRSGYGIKDTVYLHTASKYCTHPPPAGCLSGPGGWRQVAQHYQHPPDLTISPVCLQRLKNNSVCHSPSKMQKCGISTFLI